MNLVGEGVLREAVGILRLDITAKPKIGDLSIKMLGLLSKFNYVTSEQTLVDGCLFIASEIEDAALSKMRAELRALSVSDQRKGLLLSAKLVGKFSEDVVVQVLQWITDDGAARPGGAAEPAGAG